MLTVAVISPLLTLEPIRRVITSHDFGCRFRTYVYKQPRDIDGIYAECRNNTDVFFFSGELGYHYLQEHFPENRIPVAFTYYGTADVLGIIIRFQLNHPEIPLNRVYMDFLTPLNRYMQIHDYLPADRMPYFFEENGYDYDHIAERGIALWKEKKIDMIMTRCISMLDRWEAAGIPFEAVQPTEKMVRSSLEEQLNRVKLAHIHDLIWGTSVIQLAESSALPPDDREYRIATLYKLLVDFRKEHALQYRIHQGYDRFSVSSQLTVNPQSGSWPLFFLNDLKNRVDFPLVIGFGLHQNEDDSRLYAEKALMESTHSRGRDAFLVSGDPAVLTGPLGTKKAVRYSYEDANVIQLARNLRIADSVLLRLIGLYRSNPHTVLNAAELGPLLEMTPRSIRRILVRLLDCGLIESAPDAPAAGRGRPTHCYLFSADALNRALSTSLAAGGQK